MDVDEIDDDDFIIKEKMDSSYNLRERKTKINYSLLDAGDDF